MYTMSFRCGKTAAIFLVLVVVRAARALRGEDDDDPDAKWVRMCTTTSTGDRGSSEFNATMPCGVHVRPDVKPGVSESPGAVGSEKSNPEHLSETALVGDSSSYRDGNGLTAVAINETHQQSSEDGETGMVRLEPVRVDGVVLADGVPDGGDDADDDDDGVTAVAGDGDRKEADDVQVTDEDDGDGGHDVGDVPVTDEDDGDGQDVGDALVTGEDVADDVTPVAGDHGQEHEYDVGDAGGDVTVVLEGDGDPEHPPKRGRVAKVMLAYLMNARNKLYNKIRMYYAMACRSNNSQANPFPCF